MKRQSMCFMITLIIGIVVGATRESANTHAYHMKWLPPGRPPRPRELYYSYYAEGVQNEEKWKWKQDFSSFSLLVCWCWCWIWLYWNKRRHFSPHRQQHTAQILVHFLKKKKTFSLKFSIGLLCVCVRHGNISFASLRTDFDPIKP